MTNPEAKFLVLTLLFNGLLAGIELRNLRRNGHELEAIRIAGGEEIFHRLTLMLGRFETLMQNGKLPLEHALEQLIREGYASRLRDMSPILTTIPTTPTTH